MRIGFDLDGVLCDIDHVGLHLMNKLTPKEEEKAEYYYYRQRTRLLNPEDFLNDGDVYYIITARHLPLYNITKAWCDKYTPKYKGLYLVGGTPWYKRPDNDDRDPYTKSYGEEANEAKVKLINELQLDVYIDDNPKTVEYLRKNCPNCTVIRYGGRL